MKNGWSWARKGLWVWLLMGALPALAEEVECRNGQRLRCWFIIGEAYKKPERVAFIARHLNSGAVDGFRELEVVQVIEAASFPDRYAIWQMQVDCGRRLFRVTRDRAANKDGMIREEPSYAEKWTPMDAARYGESVTMHFACDPEVIKDRSGYLAAFAGTAYRVPDMVTQFRQVIWREGR